MLQASHVSVHYPWNATHNSVPPIRTISHMTAVFHIHAPRDESDVPALDMEGRRSHQEASMPPWTEITDTRRNKRSIGRVCERSSPRFRPCMVPAPVVGFVPPVARRDSSANAIYAYLCPSLSSSCHKTAIFYDGGYCAWIDVIAV